MINKAPSIIRIYTRMRRRGFLGTNQVSDEPDRKITNDVGERERCLMEKARDEQMAAALQMALSISIPFASQRLARQIIGSNCIIKGE